MRPQLFRSIRTSVRRWKRTNVPLMLGCVLILGGMALSYAGIMRSSQSSIDPVAFRPLLQLIARVESNDNYNAFFGNANNTAIDFTSMSIAEVMAWQAEHVRQGNISSAVGRYQIIDSTLTGLVRQLNLDANQRFDERTQDRLALALLERRGAAAYVEGTISKEEFAANLSKEWAALPRVQGGNPQESYYASDGINKSRVGVDEVLTVIESTAR